LLFFLYCFFLFLNILYLPVFIFLVAQCWWSAAVSCFIGLNDSEVICLLLCL